MISLSYMNRFHTEQLIPLPSLLIVDIYVAVYSFLSLSYLSSRLLLYTPLFIIFTGSDRKARKIIRSLTQEYDDCIRWPAILDSCRLEPVNLRPVLIGKSLESDVRIKQKKINK
jgi:hypothetical protein